MERNTRSPSLREAHATDRMAAGTCFFMPVASFFKTPQTIGTRKAAGTGKTVDRRAKRIRVDSPVIDRTGGFFLRLDKDAIVKGCLLKCFIGPLYNTERIPQ